MKLSEIVSPAAVLDVGRLKSNTDRMLAIARDNKVLLRPHMKTAKCINVAGMATDEARPAITVSTIKEARYFAENGFHDITYGVGLSAEKIPLVAKLQESGTEMHVILDSEKMAEAVTSFAEAEQTPFQVFIEIDCGSHRAGLKVDDERLIKIAQLIHQSAYTKLMGVFTHAGHSYHCRNKQEIEAVAEEERSCSVAAAERLRDNDLPCEVVSIGSTPSVLFCKNFDGVTEIRPGVYTFFDLFQMHMGCCGPQDLALSVIATVIGNQSDSGYVLIDAGSLALSKDISTQRFEDRKNYGHVYDYKGRQQLGDLVVTDVDQEHGFIRSASDNPAIVLPDIGEKVRIFPNHACMMSASYDTYYVVDGSDNIIDEWEKIRGW